jgi:GNAT superfamily N-acetyltransferase
MDTEPLPDAGEWLAQAPAEVDASVVRRVIEITAAMAVHANARPLRARDGELTTTRFGGAIAFQDRTKPNAGIANRVIGFADRDIGVMDEIVAFYEDAGIPCQIDVLPSRLTPEVKHELDARGFRFSGTACTSAGPPVPILRHDRDARVERIVDETLGEAMALAARMSGREPPTPSLVEARRAELPRHDHFVIAMARLDGEPAALATLFCHERAGYLANAVTLPAMRKRGAQVALLEYLVEEARRRDLDLLATDTLVGVESERNVHRVGIPAAYHAGWWVRARR